MQYGEVHQIGKALHARLERPQGDTPEWVLYDSITGLALRIDAVDAVGLADLLSNTTLSDGTPVTDSLALVTHA